jgi:hypothetical protein
MISVNKCVVVITVAEKVITATETIGSLVLYFYFCIFRYVYVSFIMYAYYASLVEQNLKQNLKVKTCPPLHIEGRTSFHFMFFVQVPRSTKIMTYFVPDRGT